MPATAAGFRKLALALPEAVEGEHMQHPDFRVHGRIFATLTADGAHGMVVLTPDQQRRFVAEAAAAFIPGSGAWGRQGCTKVVLRLVKVADLREAIAAAWQNRAAAKTKARIVRSRRG